MVALQVHVKRNLQGSLMARKKKRTYVKKDTRKLQIYRLLLSANRPVTRNEICTHLGIQQSSWTKKLFDEMVAERYLSPPVVAPYEGIKQAYWYKANDISKGA